MAHIFQFQKHLRFEISQQKEFIEVSEVTTVFGGIFFFSFGDPVVVLYNWDLGLNKHVFMVDVAPSSSALLFCITINSSIAVIQQEREHQRAQLYCSYRHSGR